MLFEALQKEPQGGTEREHRIVCGSPLIRIARASESKSVMKILAAINFASIRTRALQPLSFICIKDQNTIDTSALPRRSPLVLSSTRNEQYMDLAIRRLEIILNGRLELVAFNKGLSVSVKRKNSEL